MHEHNLVLSDPSSGTDGVLQKVIAILGSLGFPLLIDTTPEYGPFWNGDIITVRKRRFYVGILVYHVHGCDRSFSRNVVFQ